MPGKFQGEKSLVGYSPRGRKESDMTEQLHFLSLSAEEIGYPLQDSWAFLVTQIVKNLPGMRETWIQYQGWEDPLEEGMAAHSSILAWRIPMDRGAWRATVNSVAKSWTRL